MRLRSVTRGPNGSPCTTSPSGELFADRSVLLISHRFSTVRSADRIYVLSEGYVVEAGTHSELVALGGTYAELFTLQASPYR